jgi:hypothetical protein
VSAHALEQVAGLLDGSAAKRHVLRAPEAADAEGSLPGRLPLLPVSIPTFMGIVGIVELAVGAAILTRWTRVGAYVASTWLVGVAANLVLAGFYDVAVRDVVMAVGAFTLARLEEVRQGIPVYGFDSAPRHAAGRASA